MEMTQQYMVSGRATRVFADSLDGWTKVIYHSTCVIRWDKKEIVLDSGGWRTSTTKTRMNQASHQYDLGIDVFQKKGVWYVKTAHGTVDFFDGMKLNRGA